MIDPDTSTVSELDRWRQQAIEYLLAAQNSDGGWGYQQQSHSHAEPTCYAALALLSSGKAAKDVDTVTQVLMNASLWLSQLQKSNGALASISGGPESAWLTSLCLMIWLDIKKYPEAQDRAFRWLVSEEGVTYEPPENPSQRVLGHDQTLVGWPWVSPTHSWLEPTVFAILAFSKYGYGDHPRAREGLQVVRDRQEERGTWNFGNTTVFGNRYPPQPTSTGLGLIARSLETSMPDQQIQLAIEYLKGVLPSVRSAASLCWGLQGLACWDVRLQESSLWLAEAFEKSLTRSNPILQVALTLLGAGNRTLSVIGQQQRESSHDF
ncbi:MAG: terpene cyclase/mutase family protein [Planctomycetaceae bacterium]|nr:terpene cyclase/mutase family protein [Planctomycetaceae bacterium]